MRAIDADALIYELNDSHYPGAPYVDAGISIAIGKVLDAPTIEPERKTGYWIDDGVDGCGAAMIEYRNLKCGQCGWSSSLIIPRNFCPNCGEKKDSKKIVSLFTLQKGDSNV